MTRTWTPDSVNWLTGERSFTLKRACNGCGRTIGDTTDDEMQRCIDGRPLPDVRAECGCQPPEKPPICTATANPRSGLLLRCDRIAGHERCPTECDHRRDDDHWHYDFHQDAMWDADRVDGTIVQVDFRTVGGL